MTRIQIVGIGTLEEEVAEVGKKRETLAQTIAKLEIQIIVYRQFYSLANGR